jgi:hypothetical protein
MRNAARIRTVVGIAVRTAHGTVEDLDLAMAALGHLEDYVVVAVRNAAARRVGAGTLEIELAATVQHKALLGYDVRALLVLRRVGNRFAVTVTIDGTPVAVDIGQQL